MSKPVIKPVDMSVPAFDRRRKRRQSRILATPPAQLSHGTNPRARATARDGQRWLTREENARFAEPRKALLLTAGDPDYCRDLVSGQQADAEDELAEEGGSGG